MVNLESTMAAASGGPSGGPSATAEAGLAREYRAAKAAAEDARSRARIAHVNQWPDEELRFFEDARRHLARAGRIYDRVTREFGKMAADGMVRELALFGATGGGR